MFALALRKWKLHGKRVLLIGGILLFICGGNVQTAAMPANEKISAELLNAAQAGELIIVCKMITWGGSVCYRDANLNTALHLAAANGHSEVVKVLLEVGSNINSLNYFGRTPLLTASCNGKQHVARLLVGWGADINDKDSDGYTALHYAIEHQQTEATCWLLDRGAKPNQTSLFTAVEAGKLDILQELLQDDNTRAQAVECVDRNHKTLLHVAAKEGDLEIMAYLISNGAEVDAQDIYGRTPLCLAALWSRLDAVKLLWNYGACLDALEGGCSPLYEAARYSMGDISPNSKKLNIVTWLLAQGADICGAQDSRGNSIATLIRDYHHVLVPNQSLQLLSLRDLSFRELFITVLLWKGRSIAAQNFVTFINTPPPADVILS